MRSAPDRLTELVRQVVEPMGYELVGVEYVRASGSTLRVYIDQESGIVADDCAAVSRQLSAMLDVEDPVKESYQLEVSSPGLDRPLFYPEHFTRFEGRRARLKMVDKIDGRWRFEGTLCGIDENDVVLEIDGERFYLPLDQIDTARLVA